MIKAISTLFLLFLIFNTSDIYAKKSDTPAAKIYQSIQILVKKYNKSANQDELKVILKKYAQLYRYDTSYFSYDLIYPIYTKNQKAFQKIVNSKLSEAERKIIMFNIEGYKDEHNNGNDL